jgi:TPR repeat protein
MAFCENCGARLGDGAKFCGSCGAKVGAGAAANEGQNAESLFKLSMAAYKAGNNARAFEGLCKAAEMGHAVAQCNLGIWYVRGKGIQQDYAKAAEWYRKAADQGYVYAQAELGMLYYNGQGVPPDKKKAVEWFRKAAAQGHETAKKNLAILEERKSGKVEEPLDVTDSAGNEDDPFYTFPG